MLVYRQSKNLTILHISFVGKEAAGHIVRDLKAVKKKGYVFTGIVSDGGKGIVAGIREVYPHIPHQICLAHLHRDCINALGRYPKDNRVKKLKALADHVWLIESKEALAWWKVKLQKWITRYHEYLWEYRRDTEGRW